MFYTRTQNHRTTLTTGFTLIELLVVIAIIGLLSSIILPNLSGSRVRAENAKRNEIAREYITALESYHLENQQYPNEGSTPIAMICLGRQGSDSCHGPYPFTTSATLNAALDDLYPALPSGDRAIMDSSSQDWSGFAYACIETSGSTCVNYTLWWYLEDEADTSCVYGNETEGSGGITKCGYDSSTSN